jgi:hypothetical protein
MIPVWVTLTAPLYWWKEADQYKVGTVTNSCSTMHKIADKEFTRDVFSCEHLVYDSLENDIEDLDLDLGYNYKSSLDHGIEALNIARNNYLKVKNKPMKNEAARKELMKKYWWQMIQLLPSSYNQKRTWFLNYEVLSNIYHARKNHKLDEWKTLCSWIENELPYSELITGKEVAK